MLFDLLPSGSQFGTLKKSNWTVCNGGIKCLGNFSTTTGGAAGRGINMLSLVTVVWISLLCKCEKLFVYMVP